MNLSSLYVMWYVSFNILPMILIIAKYLLRSNTLRYKYYDPGLYQTSQSCLHYPHKLIQY